MPDIEQEVRALLERRANDVPPHADVPPTLVRRARTRFAVYAAGVAVAVVLVAGVGLAALRSAPEGPVTTPGDTSPTVASAAACSADQLTARAELEGAMGSREGAIILTNTGDEACVLSGTPIPVLTSDQGLASVQVDDAEPAWRVNGAMAPDGWPDVTVAPMFEAAVRVRWSNWCEASAPTWALHLPGGSNVGVDGIGGDVPPCNGPGQPSTVEIGPFEPSG